MSKSWRILFGTAIFAAVASIAWITINYIVTDKLIKATGDEQLAVRQHAAHRVMRRHKPIDFLATQPGTVRDNVVWALESELSKASGAGRDQLVGWLVDLGCDRSGDIPEGDADGDAARLAVLRLGKDAVKPLLERLTQDTKMTLERVKFAHRRAVAARLLGLIGDHGATPALVKALRDEYDLVRSQAAAALSRLHDPEGQKALADFVSPLLAVLDGRYQCYIRLDSEGRIRNTTDNRAGMLYGPFYVDVKPQSEATVADRERQRDSANAIVDSELKRQKEISEHIEDSKHGRVVRPTKGPVGLHVLPDSVTLERKGLKVKDPAHNPLVFDVVEGEPVELNVSVQNSGQGDLVSDFFVAVYAGSPTPRNNADRVPTGDFAGERARDLRGLVVPFEKRHVRSLYHRDLPETKVDDTQDQVELTLHFDTVEGDRLEALRRLMAIGDEAAIEALGKSLGSRSYIVRQQAAAALLRVEAARQTSSAGRERIIALLREAGLSSPDAVVRCSAAEGLTLATDRESADALLKLLQTDADPTVRSVATRAAAGLPSAERQRLLPVLMSGDSSLKQIVPRLLRDASDAPLAQRLLGDRDPQVAREVLRSAGRLLSGSDLVAALKSGDARVRAMAAQKLSERAFTPAAVTELMAALQDRDGGVRAAAATGLGVYLKSAGAQAGAAQVVAALVGVVKNEAGDYVGYKPGAKVEDPANAVVTDKQTRAAATAALVGSDDKDAVAAVKDALGDANPDVVAAALGGIAKLGDQRDRLKAVMADGKMPARVRQAAALALWRGGMPLKAAAGESQKADQEKIDKVLDALVGLLNDPKDAVKTAAAVTLIGLGDDRGNKVLRDQIRSKQAETRREAARLLATLEPAKVAKLSGLKDEERHPLQLLFKDLYSTGGLAVNFRFLCSAFESLATQPETLAAMQKAAGDEGSSPVLRAAGLTVLADLGDRQAASAVAKGLGDPNEFVRARAAAAAATLGLTDPATLKRLDDLLHAKADPSSEVQRQAAQALLVLQARG